MTNQRERYDLIFGMGSACGCATTLRKVGLQLTSLPFDWIGLVGLRPRVDLVERNFAGWMREENMVKMPTGGSVGHDRYIDKATGLQYWHDFDTGLSLSEALPAIREKYNRRIARLDRLIGSSQRILVVWIADSRDEAPLSIADIQHCLEVFSRRWPDREFHLLDFEYSAGVPAEAATVVSADNYEIVTFDIRNHEKGAEPWMLDTSALMRFLGRYEVRDYRTEDERKAFAKRQRQRDKKRFGTDSSWVYIVRKIEFKIYKHLKKRLERCGVIME